MSGKVVKLRPDMDTIIEYLRGMKIEEFYAVAVDDEGLNTYFRFNVDDHRANWLLDEAKVDLLGGLEEVE